LDEGVPVDVGHVLHEIDHEVIWFDDVLQRGSEDTLVMVTAQANDAILIACDGDMRDFAKQRNLRNERYKQLNLIKISCPEPMAHKRIAFAMSFIEHEWNVSTVKVARRLFVEIGTQFMKSYR
jgi:predicted nuclease of predicted toxin-antitoxin system